VKRNIMHYPVGTLSRNDSGIHFFLGTAYRAVHDERDARLREQRAVEAVVQGIMDSAAAKGQQVSRRAAEMMALDAIKQRQKLSSRAPS
jgi:hypothetical protein